MRSTIQIYIDGQWTSAAEFEPLGRPYCAVFEYLPEYIFSAPNPLPISLTLPVTMDRFGVDPESGAPACPAFLLDLVPQGRGRDFLLRDLAIPDTAESDLPLAQAGAYNPIGALRLDTAVQFFEDRQHADVDTDGFELDDILSRQEAFLEHIWLHAMLSAGTTGVQGAAPKFLLTQNQDSMWFADAALPDDEAWRHWLVKLPRGKLQSDLAVLRNEAAYLRVAHACGLRTAGDPMHRDGMLFVPRFDRLVDTQGLHRLHQETLASLAGIRGFGVPVSLFELTEAFIPHVSDPAGEVAEFLKRDILNLAMRNTDNHARNTSVQRLPDGRIRLTPIYDFAPMYLDSELIVRGCRWKMDGREITAWQDIVSLLSLSDPDKRAVLGELQAFAKIVSNLPDIMRTCGVDDSIITDCQKNIEFQAERLEKVSI